MGFIVLLDGSKGAGKSSVGKMIIEKAKPQFDEEFVLLSLDAIRRASGQKATPDNNEHAYKELLQQTKLSIISGKNVVIDCGMIAEKLQRLEETAKLVHASCYKFFLDGSYDLLMERVKQRDIRDGKIFNEVLFSSLYKKIRDKSLVGYVIFDTGQQVPEEIATAILDTISNQHFIHLI